MIRGKEKQSCIARKENQGGEKVKNEFQKRLVFLMLDKAALYREQGYISPEIVRDIMSWSDGESKRVWNEIEYNISIYGGGASAGTSCPYCIKCSVRCDLCFWGKVHGICDSDDELDLWSKTIEKHYCHLINHSEIRAQIPRVLESIDQTIEEMKTLREQE